MSDGPGLTRLYKDGDYQDFESDEVERMMAEGWRDTPGVAAVGASPGDPEPQTEE